MAKAQDSIPSFKERTSVNGYLKYLHSANVVTGGMSTYDLLHNRINLSHFYKKVRFNMGMRNRLFYGDQVVQNPKFPQQLTQDTGYFDMSWVLLHSREAALHSTFDRLNLNWANDKMELTIGRQRINWGMNLAWNANDLFNTYSFVDFDYEERPGNDAIRYQYYLQGGMSVLDVAYKPGDSQDETIAALRYRFNTKGYDIQFIGGWYNTDVAFGLGWAGNIKNVGFKGEGTYFKSRYAHLEDVATVSASWDYSFKKGLYINGSILYTSNGIDDITQLSLANSLNVTSAKNLMPTTWSGFLQTMYPVTPLLNAGVAVIYGSGMDIVFAMPSVAYSISDTWDVSLVGQIFYADIPTDGLQNLGNTAFLRLKWSF